MPTASSSPPRTCWPAVAALATLAAATPAGAQSPAGARRPDLLWESPTAGPPIALDWSLPGASCLLHLRPAELGRHPEGSKVLAALGPWGAAAVDRLQRLAGVELREVETLLVAADVDSAGGVRASLRIELVEPWSSAEFARRVGGALRGQHADAAVRVRDDRAYLLPKARAWRTVVICPQAAVDELLAAAGTPPALTRDFEALAMHTDAQRMATLMFDVRFLRTGARSLTKGAGAPLAAAAGRLLGAEAAAAAVSAHWDRDFYVELCAKPRLDAPPRRFALALRAELEALAAGGAATVAATEWPPYGRAVIERWPGMVRALVDQVRVGVDGDAAVLNAYLPASAGHNLALGAELALATREAGRTVRPAVGSAPQSLEVRLARRTSLVFPRDSLERALALLAEDLNVPIEIAGADLQAEGITRNQQLALELRNQPGREILLEILRRANPDRTATGPADSRQRLVFLLAEPKAGDTGDAGRIIVTTRSAAARRDQPLPPEFRGPAR